MKSAQNPPFGREMIRTGDDGRGPLPYRAPRAAVPESRTRSESKETTMSNLSMPRTDPHLGPDLGRDFDHVDDRHDAQFIDRIGFDRGRDLRLHLILVLSSLLIFFGVRSFRDNVAGGQLTFGKGFLVGLGIALVSAVCYALSRGSFTSTSCPTSPTITRRTWSRRRRPRALGRKRSPSSPHRAWR